MENETQVPEEKEILNNKPATTDQVKPEQESATLVGGIASVNSNSVKKTINKYFILAPIILLVFAVFGAAFYGGYLPRPFGKISQEQVLAKMFDSLSGIRSAQYKIDLSFQSEARQPGFKASSMQILSEGVVGGSSGGSVERDVARLHAIGALVESLKAYKKQNGKYPQFLNDIKVVSPDVLIDPAAKNQYGYRQEKDGVDFTLHVQMETTKGIKDFRNAVLTIPSASLRTAENMLAEVHADTPQILQPQNTLAANVTAPAYDPSVVFQNLPLDINASLHFDGLSQFEADKNAATLNADGKVSLGGMSFSAALAFIKQSGLFYGQIKEMPELGMVNLEKIKGRWVKIARDELNKFGTANFSQSLEDDKEQKIRGIVQTYLQILREEKAVSVVKELPKVKEQGVTMYHYLITIDNGKMATVYERLNSAFKQQFGEKNDLISSSWLAYLRSPEYAQLSQVARQNTQFELWVDAKNYWPRKFVSNSVFVPPESIQKLKDKEYRAQITIELSKINEPLNIESPTDFIGLEEATKIISDKNQ